MKRVSILPFVVFVLINVNTLISQNSSSKQIIEEKVKNKSISAAGVVLSSQKLLLDLYSNREFELAWKDEKDRKDLIAAIQSAYDEGLNPSDYHIEIIENLTKSNYKKLNNEDAVELDLILTDAYVLYASHLASGKVEQSKIRKEWDIPLNTKAYRVDSLLAVSLKNNKIKESLEKEKPQTKLYKNYKRSLKKFRKIVSDGGWNKIPEGETLKKGMADDRIVKVREYLALEQDFPMVLENANVFDEELEKAVAEFQDTYRTDEDGVIGAGTLKLMNVSADEIVDKIRINMERARWLPPVFDNDFLVVNIAGFYVKRFTNGKEVFYSKVIVGKVHHETPIFKGEMKYIEMNPTWTLPYSIATKETLPKLKKNPGYLNDKHMIIMDKNGKPLDPNNIDFSQYSRGNFPFILRQTAGPWNALGQVKFIFPNQHSVYLHDTPSRSLFKKKDNRAFSHGCIRLDKKWELLMSLTGDSWDMDRINKVLESGETTRIDLKEPINIYLFYGTISYGKDGKMYIDKDVYNRDPAVLKALNTPVF